MSRVESSAEVESLVAGLADPESRMGAVAKLRRMGPEASAALAQGLRAGPVAVRRWCALLLDEQGTASATSALHGALSDQDAGVRRVAVHAIGCQPCKAEPLQIDVVELLAQCLNNDPSIRVKRVAAHMLGCQPPDLRAVEALKKARDSSEDGKLLRNIDWAVLQHSRLARPKG